MINSKNCDLTNYKNLIKFSKIKFDLIFHLAAWTQAGDFCLKYPGKQWLINQQINTNILKFWYEFQNKAKMIIIGTSCSYSDNLPLTEENYMKGEQFKVYTLTV